MVIGLSASFASSQQRATDAMEAGPVMSIVVDIIVRHTSSVKTRSILTAERLKELRLRVSPYCATVMPKIHGTSIIVA